MKRATAVTAAVMGLALAGCATAPIGAPVAREGFLSETEGRALAQALAPLGPDDPALLAAAPVDEERWWMATAQAELRAPEALQHFDCLLDTRLGARPRPALTRLMQRLALDAKAATAAASARAFRPRPIAVDPALQPCQRVTSRERAQPSWPASGAVLAGAYAAALADLAPDRAEALRRRGEVLAESRVICRMNSARDAADGLALGRAVQAEAARTPAYAAEREAARTELAAARAEGLTNPGCASERRVLGDPTIGVRPGAG